MNFKKIKRQKQQVNSSYLTIYMTAAAVAAACRCRASILTFHLSSFFSHFL